MSVIEESILKQIGFIICKFGPDKTTCDRCKEQNRQLYFGNRNFFDSREGDYYCSDCVLELHKFQLQLDIELNETPHS